MSNKIIHIEPQSRNYLLLAALAYAEHGIPVFPCKQDKSPHYSQPDLEHGFLNATTDPEQIRGWWTRWPNAMIGAPTGTRFDVLDLDSKNGKDGLAVVSNWAELSPLIACTGNGGRHLYFRPDGIPCTSDEIALGVDTRGSGGYVIVPPSTGYSWLNH